MRFDTLETLLTRKLAEPLPGHEAQECLSPRPRVGWVPGEIPDNARDGAGLLLLFPDAEGEARLILTVRQADLPNHAGQVSLPGGAAEAGESLVEAALRESREEVGVSPDAVRVLGELTSLYIPVSGFALHPFVGVSDARPDMVPDPREVARILEVPVRTLMDASHLHVTNRQWRGRSYGVPYVAVEGERIWGATAMILAEFLALCGHRPDPWNEDAGESGPFAEP